MSYVELCSLFCVLLLHLVAYNLLGNTELAAMDFMRVFGYRGYFLIIIIIFICSWCLYWCFSVIQHHCSNWLHVQLSSIGSFVVPSFHMDHIKITENICCMLGNACLPRNNLCSASAGATVEFAMRR